MGLIIDSFAGGGGASLGIEWATGRSPDIAINHDAEALAMHAANHPTTHHMSKNIWKVDPLDAVHGQDVDLAWFSPDCKHHSKAKGGKPVKRNIRDLAWVVVLWAQRVRPSIICLENVEEFEDWGPLDENDMPDRSKAGQTFKKFVRELRRLGYKVQWRQIRASEHGQPTIRKRLFMIARCDGQPIVWPSKTHNKNGTRGKQPFKTAATHVIDWSLPCPSIFATSEEIMEQFGLRAKRPLVDNTLARIAKGMRKFIFEHPDPFIVTCNHGGSWQRSWDIHEPFKTVTASRDAHGVVVPFMAQHNTGVVGRSADAPVSTILERGTQTQLVAPFMVPRYGERPGQDPRCRGICEPYASVVPTANGGSLVAAHMINMHGSDRRGSDAREPVNTITSGGQHIGEVRAFLMKYHRDGGQFQDCREPMHTVPANDEFGLVQIHGAMWRVADIGMRMLTPRELFRAQGFPESYIIDPVHNGRRLTKTAQIKMCGNSVCPGVAQAIVAANYRPAMERAA